MESANKETVALHSPDPLPDLYHYSPIDKGASEIRLMALLPDGFEAKIRVIIINTVLSRSLIPKYEALSYTWGSATDLDYIHIQEYEGEKALAITPSLAEALRYLRYEDHPRVLWIDAICVDQNNTAERGHQVLRMADIYHQASRVIIWLGPERDNSNLAIQELDALGQTIEMDWDRFITKPLSGETYDQWLQKPMPFTEDQRTLAAIESFLDRSWFKRLWIWQEVRLANVGTLMMCGRDFILWNTFRDAIVCLFCKRRVYRQLNQIMELCNYSRSLPRLKDLLQDTQYAQCSDERDRIYAILNISSDFLGFEPDYSKTTRDVFKNVVLACSKRDLTVLSRCEMRENTESCVPTWVPDWTRPRESSIMYHVRACPTTTEPQARCDKDNVLVVSGYMIDTLDVIQQISPSAFGYSTEYMRKIVRNMLGGRAEMDTFTARDSMIDSVCRTLCYNVFSESFLPLRPELPNVQESKKYVRDLMANRELVEYDKYNLLVYGHVKGRASFQTRNGHIGIGPQSIRAGDQAYMILGCESLLILRPNDEQTYKVVGECYVDGFMQSEVLLGALPSNWQRVSQPFPDLSGRYFMNVQTGDIQVEDPRLSALPAGWRIADHKEKHAYNLFSNEELGVTATRFDPRLSSEALKAKGVDLQEIRLV